MKEQVWCTNSMAQGKIPTTEGKIILFLYLLPTLGWDLAPKLSIFRWDEASLKMTVHFNNGYLKVRFSEDLFKSAD